MSTETETLPDVESWEELLRDFKYRKGYEVYYHYHIDFNRSYIFVEVWTEDTYNPGSMIRVVHRRDVPEFKLLGQTEALKWLQRILHSVECHESDEFFRFRGEMIFDPHK